MSRQSTFRHNHDAHSSVLDLTDVMRIPGERYASLAREAPEAQREGMLLVVRLATAVAAAGGRALVVGGAVRDQALGTLAVQQPMKDIDLELYGLSLDRIRTLLADFGSVDEVGEHFGVMKLGQIDISVPRSDTKVDRGHRGFVTHPDPWLPFREAARRRDFTLNAVPGEPTADVVGSKKSDWGRSGGVRLGRSRPFLVTRSN